MRSKNLVRQNKKNIMESIMQYLPNVIKETEGEGGKIIRAVDFQLLKQELSDMIIDSGKERYQFTWPGKKKAMAAANVPIEKPSGR